VSDNVGDTGRQLAHRIDALVGEMRALLGDVLQHVGPYDTEALATMAEEGKVIVLRLDGFAKRVREGNFKPATVWRKPTATRG
jgi:hypothetical protein